MNEKAFKIMSGSGATDVVVGVVVLVTGIASGVVLLISGAKLLKGRYHITF